MDRSKLSNVLASTRLLLLFSPRKIETMRLCIYQELGCETEAQFLCKVLQSTYKSLSNKSLTNIKNKAVEIANAELIYPNVDNNENHTNVDNCKTKNNHITAHKYIQQQYHDPLSQLQSDIIDYLGTFLSKKQSIEFGYLNKQLYIETQKQSYLLNRCKDNAVKLNDNRINAIFLGKIDAFNYTFPKKVFLNLHKNNGNTTKMTRSMVFTNFFCRVNTLTCWNIFSLSCVPLELLLNVNVYDRYTKSISRSRDGCDHNIQQLKILSHLFSVDDKQRWIDDINLICDKFDKYTRSFSNNIDKFNKLRLINALKFDTVLQIYPFDELNSLNNQLLIRLGSISKSIHLQRTTMVFESIDELKAMFQLHLKHIHFDMSSKIKMNTEICISESESIAIATSTIPSVSSSTPNNINNKYKVGYLEHVEIHATYDIQTHSHTAAAEHSINILKELDRFSMRRNVHTYTIHWQQCEINVDNPKELELGTAHNLLRTVFFENYDKHPLLQEIIIDLTADDCHLFGLATLLFYFNQYYTQLFVETKLHLTHFKRISIKYNKIEKKMVHGKPTKVIQLPHRNDFYGTRHYTDISKSFTKLFQQKINETYRIEKNVIEIKKMVLTKELESFGVIYKNVFHWLQQRQLKSVVNGCKIVFVIE